MSRMYFPDQLPVMAHTHNLRVCASLRLNVLVSLCERTIMYFSEEV